MANAADGTRAALDVLVAGAGYVGLAVAVALKSARPGLEVGIVDAAPAGAWEKDGRASAIAAAAGRMLDQLGCWAEIAPEAQAITEMIITDSRTADPVRPEPAVELVEAADAFRVTVGALQAEVGRGGAALIRSLSYQGRALLAEGGAGLTAVDEAGRTFDPRLVKILDRTLRIMRDRSPAQVPA